jgi:hypothetical protein
MLQGSSYNENIEISSHGFPLLIGSDCLGGKPLKMTILIAFPLLKKIQPNPTVAQDGFTQ